MLGWMVSVYRQVDVGQRAEPATLDSARGERLARWQGDVSALAWIRELCTDGRGVALGGNGYPTRFSARCSALRPLIEAGPPRARTVWVSGVHDRIDRARWEGRTTVSASLSDCPPDEWLLVEAWDES